MRAREAHEDTLDLGPAAREVGPDHATLQDLEGGDVEALGVDLGRDLFQRPASVVELAVALAQRHELTRLGEALVIVVERLEPALLAVEYKALGLEAPREI